MQQGMRAARAAQRSRRVRRSMDKYGAVNFFNLLAGPMGEWVDSLLPVHRERLYPPTVTLSMFVDQVLSADPSCQQAVCQWAAMRAAEGLPGQSVRTGGYCRARQRLPCDLIRELARQSGMRLCAQSKAAWCWQGRAVKLIDGTGLSLQDTPANRARWPQLGSQAPGVGFPQIRMVGVLCLSTGAVLDVAFGPFEGKGTGEGGLTRQLLSHFVRGDVVVADALYASYWQIACLQAAGVDVVFRQHGGRRTDFRCGRRLGKRDHIVEWHKPRQRPAWMSREEYDAMADRLVMREVGTHGEVLVTTMLDAREVPGAELVALYAQRWNIELDLRNIKTTLGCEVLRCRTPAMVEKELWTCMLAYNLVRLLMCDAATVVNRRPRSISFKLAVQSLLPRLRQPSRRPAADRATLLAHIVQQVVGNRPGRCEPRQRKRRPKPFPLMTRPRDELRQQVAESRPQIAGAM